MIKIFYYETPATFRTNVMIVDEKPNGERYYARPVDLIFEKIDNNSYEIEPTLKFDGFNGRVALEELRKAFGETQESRELSSIKYHLEDMRSLVFKKNKD